MFRDTETGKCDVLSVSNILNGLSVLQCWDTCLWAVGISENSHNTLRYFKTKRQYQLMMIKSYKYFSCSIFIQFF